MTGIISLAGRSMLQLVISRRLGVYELGLYYLAAKLAFIPAEISSEVIGAVAFPLFSRLQSDVQQSARAFRSILTGMSALLFPICALMIALTPSLVQNVLGPQWVGSELLIRLLALVNVIGLFGDSVSPILKGTGRPDKTAFIELIQSTLLISMIWILAGPLGVAGAALAWIIAVGSTQVISAVFVMQILPQPLSGLGKPLALLAAVSVLGAMISLGIDQLMPNLIGFVIAGCVAGTAILALTWLTDQLFSLRLFSDMARVFPQVATLLKFSASET